MPKRREIARIIAHEIFECIDPTTADETKVLTERVFAALYETNVIENKEFYGSSFNAERCKLLRTFAMFHGQAMDYAELYNECIEPVQAEAPNFAMSSDVLVRMYCKAHYTRELCIENGPFADLLVVQGNGVDDDDCSDDDNDNITSEEEEGSLSDDDDIIATSSDESSEEEEVAVSVPMPKKHKNKTSD
tara:strand:+ start:648 stop:1217 length:570 start_codon:yes stop_codon:yes gene_type:complete